MRRGPGGRDRGQIIILAAFVIAAMFVGLALVLNSGIYAENLSSRETTDTDGALSFTLATDEAIAGAYEQTNAANESSASDAEATFGEVMDNWTRAQQRNGAAAGIGVDVERTAHVGWRLEQDEDGSFTPEGVSGSTSWQVVDGGGDVAEFEMNVTRSDLHDADADWETTDEAAFNVTVVGNGGGGTEWRLYVFQDSGNDSIIVRDTDPTAESSLGALRDTPDDSTTCIADGVGRAVIDFRGEQFAGTSCPALNFSDDVGGSVDVYFQNTEPSDERVNGTYTLVVNGSSAVTQSDFNDPTGSAPTAQGIVYSAAWASHYGRAELSHERSGRYMVREETYAN
jgi:hypothetical protein